MGALFVDRQRLTDAVEVMRGSAALVQSAPAAVPVADLAEQGDAGAAALAGLCAAVDAVNASFALQVGFLATAAADLAARAVTADRIAAG